MTALISEDLIASLNHAAKPAHDDEFAALGRKLARQGVDIEAHVTRAIGWSVAIPTWGVGTGGTRFARFPGRGEPRHIHDKLADCGVIQALTRGARTVSPHIPWDKVSDYNALRQEAAQYGLGFDAINSNSFQDQVGQKHSYKFGSLANAAADTRAQAVAHNLECIEIGAALGSPALTVWVGDGTNFPGQQSLGRMFENYLQAMEAVYAALPDGMQMFIEHKMYEPAFYSTVISDWGSSLMAAQHLGPKAKCLVLATTRQTSTSNRSRRDWYMSGGWPGSTSTIRNMATMTWMLAQSIRSDCSWSSTNWSRPNTARPRGSHRPT